VKPNPTPPYSSGSARPGRLSWLAPELLVVAAFRLDRGAHLLLARLGSEEVADAVPEFG
jgi:hypothetical protein